MSAKTSHKKGHWEAIYRSKDLREVGWFQHVPVTSLQCFRRYQVPQSARIIDVGGGHSSLVDHLLEAGYQHLTVLDISRGAIETTRNRLGEHADDVEWIHSDITAFKSPRRYEVWHDRAVFHFLRTDEEISAYLSAASDGVVPGGLFFLGTFSLQGPDHCSGLPVTQYSAASLEQCFKPWFEQIEYWYEDHVTPSGSVQNYVFSVFKRRL